jgi:hypothetical protein
MTNRTKQIRANLVSETRTFDNVDAKGRKHGIRVITWDAVFVAQDDQQASYWTKAPGFYYAACIEATKNGTQFGAGQPAQFFATVAERDAAIAKRDAAARLKDTKAKQVEPVAPEAPAKETALDIIARMKAARDAASAPAETVKVTYTDINRNASWTADSGYADLEEAKAYASKVCRGHARTGSYVTYQIA